MNSKLCVLSTTGFIVLPEPSYKFTRNCASVPEVIVSLLRNALLLPLGLAKEITHDPGQLLYR